MLRHYGVTDFERTPELEEAVFRVFLAQQRSAPEVQLATSILQRWLAEPIPTPPHDAAARDVLDRLVVATQLRFPVVGDLARSVRFRWFDQPLVDAERASVLAGVRDELAALAAEPEAPDHAARIDALAAIPEQIVRFLAERLPRRPAVPEHEPMLEVLIKRHYREHELHGLRTFTEDGRPFAVADYTLDGRPTHLSSTIGAVDELVAGQRRSTRPSPTTCGRGPTGHESVVDLYLHWPDEPESPERGLRASWPPCSQQLPFAQRGPPGRRRRRAPAAGVPSATSPSAPPTARWSRTASSAACTRWSGAASTCGGSRDFDVTRLEAPEDVLLYECVATDNPDDQRLVALAQVRQLVVVRDETGPGHRPAARRARHRQLPRGDPPGPGAPRRRGPELDMNHVWVQIWPTIEADLDQLTALQGKIAPLTAGAGIEEVLVQAAIAAAPGEAPLPIAGALLLPARVRGRRLRRGTADRAAQAARRLRRRRWSGPAAAASSTPTSCSRWSPGDGGTVVEHDLDDTGCARARSTGPTGLNKAGIIAAVVTLPDRAAPRGRHPGAALRRPAAGRSARSPRPSAPASSPRSTSPSRCGCRVEWFALSAGARISMDSGTENMDWVARALKRIIEFTQAGGEINIVVAGINVGAQPYWNAEATMLMHTKGILVMTPDSAMVLTGKQSLDFSGGVSAEDNFGIGGYDRVMGPNGQAQYWAPDLAGARDILMAHYDHTYVSPGRVRPAPGRRRATRRPRRHALPARRCPDSDFTTVGDIFSLARPTRTARRRSTSAPLMRAVADQDHEPLERWAGMADAETAVVQDAHLGGIPVCLIGIESKSVPRRGFPPTDGPDAYTAGTLFPRSSQEGGPGHQRRERQPARSSCWPTCRASTARRSRCAASSSSTAPRSAGPSSTSTARSSSPSSRATTAARSSSSPRRSTRA